MDTLVDDIGSFPLPNCLDRKLFDEAYILAREAIANEQDIRKNDFLFNNFYRVILGTFKKKLSSNLDVVTYPQHYDMHMQFIEPIRKAMDRGTYIVDEKQAIIPEIHVIRQEAKQLAEQEGIKILLRACITGPMDLYLKEVGTTSYKDILLMFAETVNRFAKNSILNAKYVKTEVISLDEPSFGFQNLTAEKDTIIDVLEKAFDFRGVTKQIHLHSSTGVATILSVKNVDVLSFEYAASPKNIEAVSRKMLEEADKQIRIGVARTDINSIMAELYEKGIVKPNADQLVEDEGTIRRRYLTAKEKYADRLAFTGPDCGLGGWPSQETALLLLKRTANAVKSAHIPNL